MALIGASVGNMLYSGYLHSRIAELEENQGRMLHYIDMVGSLAADNAKRITALNATLTKLSLHEYRFERVILKEIRVITVAQRLTLILGTCGAVLEQVSRSLAKTQQVWTLALQGHISLNLISPEQARAELSRIKASVGTMMELAIDPDDLQSFYGLPCNLLRRPGGFVLVIAVPVYNARQTYDLYRHLPAPVAIDNNLEMFVDTDETFLVVNRERTVHSKMTPLELQACTHVKHLYLCPHQRIFRKTTDPSCLFHLWTGEITKVQRTCDHRVRAVGRTDLLQLAPDRFLVVAS